MIMPVKNIIAAIVFAVIGIGYGSLASGLPDRAGIGVPGPAFFPQLIAGLIVFLSMALAYKGISGLKDLDQQRNDTVFPAKAICLISWFVAFIYSLPYLGFLFAGVPFFAGLMMMCQSRRWLQLTAGAATIPIVLFYLFRDGFHILLPHAQWM